VNAIINRTILMLLGNCATKLRTMLTSWPCVTNLLRTQRDSVLAKTSANEGKLAQFKAPSRAIGGQFGLKRRAFDDLKIELEARLETAPSG